MISVLTLTYKRHHLLEEAIESFLQQEGIDLSKQEMVVINDNPEVDYVFDHPSIKIINHKERFPSISAKIEWGYKQCKYNYIYRLDDDDLLAQRGLLTASKDILDNAGYEIYRSKGMYFFSENKFDSIQDSINNGNIYTKAYLDRITFPDKSGDEDADITFHHDGKIFQSRNSPTMIYRWGMSTLHISGMGNNNSEAIFAQADRVLDNRKGMVHLRPHFISNYYEQIDNNSK
jgi:glycosyltransferase involved in cell wall biosynthesis